MQQVINLEYLKSLNKPQEAISAVIWLEVTEQIKLRMKHNPEFNYICLQKINKIAPQFGLVWNNVGDSEPCIDYVNYSFNDMYNIKYVSDWFKRSLCLSIFGLYELEDIVEIKDVYQKVYKHSAKEIKEIELIPGYEEIRLSVNKFLTKEKKNITNENFDELYKRFVKTVIKVLLLNGDFNTKDVPKYINIMYARFGHCETFKQINEDLELDSSDVNLSNIIFKFISEFKKAYSSDEHLKQLCGKFESFYDTALDTLVVDYNYYLDRNLRLKGIKMFQKYFITEQLGDYI